MSATGYLAGLAAEETVARDYLRRGLKLAGRRWRGRSGEIDLIARDGDGLVFVEVKKSRSFARAAERLTRRQIDRILMAAQEFCAGEPLGQLTEMRFDVALVDGAGRLEILENVLAA
ncbi:YraN family protein [Actibacterium sp. XHP0104]|uniref:YraN family protein n=1 Tax=Actibacterium sp. XHP0104 TaxID=2984335 RepID=UPI0021E868FA|nr:YraN family protein [Actibacterium sp. XHP0104]MCV2882673.1 YraN family protein [Actibacterium sp. XHP0104]